MVRKQHYACEAFIRRHIKNSTFGFNAKLKVFSDGLKGNITIIIIMESAKLNVSFTVVRR